MTVRFIELTLSSQNPRGLRSVLINVDAIQSISAATDGPGTVVQFVGREGDILVVEEYRTVAATLKDPP